MAARVAGWNADPSIRVDSGHGSTNSGGLPPPERRVLRREPPLAPTSRTPTRLRGLKYFELNEALDLQLEFHPEEPTPVEIGTSDGQVRTYYRAGKIRFEVEGEPVELTALRTPGHPGYFLPFRDATSGKESYGAGRYLDLEEAVDGKLHVDFNLAYNPYCAYSDDYSCALPPHENWLTVPITAGEKTYK